MTGGCALLYSKLISAEFVKVYIAGKDKYDSNGVKVTCNEPWRSSKLLGSLSCSTMDIFPQIHLGNIAFANLKKVRLQEKCIS